jgi:hypothetical protein
MIILLYLSFNPKLKVHLRVFKILNDFVESHKWTSVAVSNIQFYTVKFLLSLTTGEVVLWGGTANDEAVKPLLIDCVDHLYIFSFKAHIALYIFWSEVENSISANEVYANQALHWNRNSV